MKCFYQFDDLKWSDMYPDGRYLYYEGSRPATFAKEMKAEFGFDPREGNEEWNRRSGYRFLCPAEHLDVVYSDYSGYPLGS